MRNCLNAETKWKNDDEHEHASIRAEITFVATELSKSKASAQNNIIVMEFWVLLMKKLWVVKEKNKSMCH